MQLATDIIKAVAEQTNRVILFHSASGKDSIALIDLIAPHFDEVVCVYLYIVKDLDHINRYISYTKAKYPNVRFVQMPHFSLASYIKYGYLGCAQNPKQKLQNMASATDFIRERFGIEWAFFGFKQSDSMNRRLMLRGYEMNGLNMAQKKAYPLSEYKNKDVLEYIKRKGLITPESYGKGQSAGTNISDVNYLLFLRKESPNDLDKVIAQFPLVERLLFEYDYNNQNK